jgi:hypothetical protein
MKRKRRIKKYRSLTSYRITKILEDLVLGLDKAILQLKIQQLEMDNNLERMKLLMNYEKVHQQTI